MEHLSRAQRHSTSRLLFKPRHLAVFSALAVWICAAIILVACQGEGQETLQTTDSSQAPSQALSATDSITPFPIPDGIQRNTSLLSLVTRCQDNADGDGEALIQQYPALGSVRADVVAIQRNVCARTAEYVYGNYYEDAFNDISRESCNVMYWLARDHGGGFDISACIERLTPKVEGLKNALKGMLHTLTPRSRATETPLRTATPKPNIGVFDVGGVAVAENLRITIDAVSDPYYSTNQFSRPKIGYRFTAIKVTIENVGQNEQSVGPYSFSLTTYDSFQYDPAFLVFGDAEPELSYITLGSGNKTEGWFGFEVKADASLKELKYDPNLFTTTDHLWRR